MNPRQWARVTEVFSKASALNPEERNAYLQHACRNLEILREVESLLAQRDKGESILGLYSSLGGKVLSHYEVGPPIGSGGLAIIYKGRDTRLNRPVAMKSLHPWQMSNPRLKDRLLREARLASALNHPNIVTIYDIAEEQGMWVIVMEHISGKTLDAVIPADGLLAPIALRYGLQIADALKSAESAGILHGDLKPANIMITERDDVKVLDFGLATVPMPERTSTDIPEPFGTKAYMAPERLTMKHDPDVRSEIFSFGLVLHEMLTSHHAFAGTSPNDIASAIQNASPTSLPSSVPANIAHVVEICLKKNPRLRFQSMEDLFLALQRCAGGEHRPHIEASMSPVPLAAPRSRHPEAERVQALLSQMTYRHVSKSKRALVELSDLLQQATSEPVRQAVALGLRELIVDIEYGSPGAPPAIRDLRQFVLRVMKMASGEYLGHAFNPHDLEQLDLYGMDFSGTDLHGLSFRGSFLVETTFEGCNLRQASLAQAYIRNVNFQNADLSDTDLTEADWFNALFLNSEQLQAVRPGTLLDCPPDISGMHRYLENRYRYPFSSWGVRVQDALKSAWQEYLRPGGIQDVLRNSS